VALLVKDINCRQAVRLIGDYLEGKLPRRDRRRLEAHLANCDACSAYLEQMRATIAVTGAVGPEDLSPAALDALLEVFDNFQRERGEHDPHDAG
jgi:anti-sigma factor RsiW